MADQLFKKRRAKKAAELSRQQAQRESYDKVLIVCEGTRTEPNYLNEIKDELKLSTANVSIAPSPGSDPLSVVEHAEALVNQQSRQKHQDNYDRVFCVFDKDEHEQHGNRYSKALNKISQINIKGVTFSAITSNPCFEVWPVLHFEPRTAPFLPTSKRTAAQEVAHHLSQYLPGYEKGRQGLYSQIKGQTKQATTFAKRLEQQNKKSGSDNPSTQMHVLVDYLYELKWGEIAR
ncbi:RloB domain-containing protein [Thalassotalea sp. G20_0]|uniref:RloB family protein n=1 Tax=Thalassotalea sp. G20_0 TaxID=2821093 RepID=UPI001AD9C393|nr:RloB domain-containing protein [Thalassotalea sp. G20_0]